MQGDHWGFVGGSAVVRFLVFVVHGLSTVDEVMLEIVPGLG